MEALSTDSAASDRSACTEATVDRLRDSLALLIRRGARRALLVDVGAGPSRLIDSLRRTCADTGRLVGACVAVSDCALDPSLRLPPPRGSEFVSFEPDVLVLCSDPFKDELLAMLNRLPWRRFPTVLTYGVVHQDAVVLSAEEMAERCPEKSHATGYPFVKAHIYEVLRSMRTRYSDGFVVELGVFRGGTLLLMKEMLRSLAFEGPQLVGFDTFAGFPPRRCLLDLFSMEAFVNRDYEGTTTRLAEEGIEVIRGDIVETASWLAGKDLLLTFVDTDNYSPVAAALPVCWASTVPGGAVVFDHFYTKEEFLDTIGERVAAWEFFRARTDYLHLSGTGVFLKI